MILDRKPLGMSEVSKILETIADSDKKEQIEIHLKKFLKKKSEKANKIKEELEGLGMLKLKERHIVKVMDVMTEDVSDINKIFTDVDLTEDETNKILEIVKNNK